MRFFALLAVVAAVSAQVELPYDECCPDGCLADDGTVVADPDPSTIPIPGNVTVILSGNLLEDVTGGTFEIVGRVLGVPVETLSGDLCTDLEGVECPLAAGPIEIKTTAEVPIQPPFGVPIDVHAEAFNQDGEFIICADFEIDVSFHKY